MQANNYNIKSMFLASLLFLRRLFLIKKYIILFFLCFGLHLFSSSQSATNSNNSISLPYENVNLQLDRDIYLSGESMWFTAHINIENDQQALSKILYIELFNADQKSLARKKFRIVNGKTQGAFEIPSEFLSDTYFLRAYTSYDKNFPSDFFYITTVEIINPRIGLPAKGIDSISEISIFNLSNSVDKQPLKIGFIIPKNLQKGNNKVFLLANNKFQNQATLLKNGWGELDFIVRDSIKYKLAFISSSADTVYKELYLKSSNKFSIGLQAAALGERFVWVTKPANIEISPTEIFHIELCNNQLKVISDQRFSFSNHDSQFKIPQDAINVNGIYFILLKNRLGRIIAVHCCAQQNENINSPELSIYKKELKQREKINLSLNKMDTSEIKDIAVKIIQKGTEFSSLKKLTKYILEPHLLLSYIKTQFNPQDLTEKELDIVMHFINYQINKESTLNLLFPPATNIINWIPEIRDIGLSGTVVDKQSNKPMSGIPIYLSVFKGHPQIHIYDSREDGSFIFSLNNFEQNQYVFLCPLIDKTDEMELKINTDFSPDFPKLTQSQFSVDSTYAKLLEQMLVASQTASVYKTDSKKQEIKFSALPYSFANPEISIVLDDYVETPTLEMVFKELVPSIYVRKRKDKYSLSIYDTEREIHYNDPLILVDNIPIFNVNELLKVSPKIIEKVEAHPTPFILGDHNINGIIMISTLTDDFGGINMPKSSTFFEYQTLSPNYRFQAKTYNSPKDLNSRIADFRTLLYWNPVFNNTESSAIYTSDQTGNYDAIIFGHYKNGQTFRFKNSFKVVKKKAMTEK